MAVLLDKPPSIASDEFQSRKWDELTADHDYGESDIPDLMTLCSWYAVLDQCMKEINAGGSTQVAYENEKGDLKPMPQIATMKQASAEIRALRKALAASPVSQTKAEKDNAGGAQTPLQKAMRRRELRLVNGGKAQRKTGT
ncbi:P27 family phage terminase small subunit [Bifidobacterium aemilianum]|uniref:P27 family phage terminase small subunit n=1 Tax=Bifidobacterium aemilianum TaxID=2493120 RepID=UPI001374E40D|nr:P27 family phage terminase small subunit [Bifidobacterium aemilianum]